MKSFLSINGKRANIIMSEYNWASGDVHYINM